MSRQGSSADDGSRANGKGSQRPCVSPSTPLDLGLFWAKAGDAAEAHPVRARGDEPAKRSLDKERVNAFKAEGRDDLSKLFRRYEGAKK